MVPLISTILFIALIGANVGMRIPDTPLKNDAEAALNQMGTAIELLVAQASNELNRSGVSVDLHKLIDVIPLLKINIAAQLDSDEAQGELLTKPIPKRILKSCDE